MGDTIIQACSPAQRHAKSSFLLLHNTSPVGARLCVPIRLFSLPTPKLLTHPSPSTSRSCGQRPGMRLIWTAAPPSTSKLCAAFTRAPRPRAIYTHALSCAAHHFSIERHTHRSRSYLASKIIPVASPLNRPLNLTIDPPRSTSHTLPAIAPSADPPRSTHTRHRTLPSAGAIPQRQRRPAAVCLQLPRGLVRREIWDGWDASEGAG
ncbi:hypothetical protein B0H10DRAFT_2155622 [Mycena sp. CBHHK59/15]|nr:hypothetical protein B0H10DRAFT_2155622 [Mycena sp. CBHHK59/15]